MPLEYMPPLKKSNVMSILTNENINNSSILNFFLNKRNELRKKLKHFNKTMIHYLIQK